MSLTESIEGILIKIKKIKKARRNLDFPLIQTSDTITRVKWLKTVYAMLEEKLKMSGKVFFFMRSLCKIMKTKVG